MSDDNPQYELQLLKLLLSYEFYDSHRSLVVKEMFGDQLEPLYKTIISAHENYKKDLSLAELRALFKKDNPTVTRAQANNIYELINDMELSESSLGPDVAYDILQHMWKSEVGRRIAEEALKLMENKSESLEPIVSIIERTQDNFLPAEMGEVCTTDVDELLELLDTQAKFNFNLAGLGNMVSGVSPGDFIMILARPETGKTAFITSMVSGPGGFASQGHSVHVICNEEPAPRTMLRMISAWTGMARDEIIADRGKAKSLFQQIKENVRLVYDTDMTIEKLDAYCRQHKPDVLIVDQLDKLGVFGSFARGDERLGKIYVKARQIAIRHDCAVFGVCQASAEAEGKTVVTYAHAADSKTAKAAECDLIMGLGRQPINEELGQEDHTRFITLSKNKITGKLGKVVCMIDPPLSRYVD